MDIINKIRTTFASFVKETGLVPNYLVLGQNEWKEFEAFIKYTFSPTNSTSLSKIKFMGMKVIKDDAASKIMCLYGKE